MIDTSTVDVEELRTGLILSITKSRQYKVRFGDNLEVDIPDDLDLFQQDDTDDLLVRTNAWIKVKQEDRTLIYVSTLWGRYTVERLLDLEKVVIHCVDVEQVNASRFRIELPETLVIT